MPGYSSPVRPEHSTGESATEALVATATALATATTADDDPRWQFLRRDLALPVFRRQDGCPVAVSLIVSSAWGGAIGHGPIYAISSGRVAVRPIDGSPWLRQKFPFVSSAVYRGEALVRGNRIDGEGELRFATENALPAAELRLPIDGNASSPSQEPGWRFWSGFVVVDSPGCYAMQIDGLDFSYAVVFAVRVEAAE